MAENKEKKPIVQAVTAVAVLVIICLVCCALLAVLNDALYITEDERFNRTIQKVYSNFEKDKTFNEEINAEFKSNPNYGEIIRVARSTDGVYVLTSKGINGFKGGSVTILVAISGDKEDPRILGWAIQENDGQTIISNITETDQKTWFINDPITMVQPNVSPDAGAGKGSGATYSENAIANAINMACYYCQNALGLGANPEGDAKQAVLELLGADYADYTLNTVGIDRATVDGTVLVADYLSGASDKLSYLMCGAGDKGNVIAYVYGEGDSLKLVVSTESGIVSSDNVDGSEDFYAKIVANPIYTFSFGSYRAYAIVTASDNGVITVAGLKVGTTPNTYVLKVTVAKDGDAGKVSAIELVSDGFVDHGPAHDSANALLGKLVGVTAETIGAAYDGGKVGGATESANLIRAAVEAALNYFDANSAKEG